MKRISLFVVGIITVLTLSFAWYQSVHAPGKALNTVTVTLTGPDGRTVSVKAEVADDPLEQQQGLMYRDHLPDGQGMIFTFNKPEALAFWMKHTLIPLDILYFDEDGTFVSRTTMSPCTTEDCPTYPSGKPSSFALEVNAGENRAASVDEGWTLAIE